MILTKEEQHKRWPNIFAMTAGLLVIEDLTEEKMLDMDKTDKRLGKNMSDPAFHKFMLGTIGPAMIKVAKEKNRERV